MSTSTGTRSSDVDFVDQPLFGPDGSVAMVVAVVVTANVYDGNGDAAGGDPFGATTAMRYVVYLTIAYMLARGLAKSGSREVYDA